MGGACAVLSFLFNAPSGTPREVRRIVVRRFPPFARFSTPQPYAGFSALVGRGSTSNRRVMTRDDDNFRIRPGKVRDRSSARPPRAVRQRAKTFIGEVHQAIRRAGGNPNRGTSKASGRFNARGRGAGVAASLKGRNGRSRDGSGVRTRSRRVAVKARVAQPTTRRRERMAVHQWQGG